MVISFIVFIHNQAHLLERFLHSMMRQPYQELEVIVADVGSEDHVKGVMKEFAHVEYISLRTFPSGTSFGEVVNVIIPDIQGEIVTIQRATDEDFGTDLGFIPEFFAKRTSIGCILTPKLNRANRVAIGRAEHPGVAFSQEGFVDGTIKGRYQAFLRKEAILDYPYDETTMNDTLSEMLSWLNISDRWAFVIENIPTCFVDMGHQPTGQGLFSPSVMHVRYQFFCLAHKRFGETIKEVSLEAYHTVTLLQAYYAMHVYGRSEAFAHLCAINLRYVDIGKFLAMILCIIFGKRAAEWFYNYVH